MSDLEEWTGKKDLGVSGVISNISSISKKRLDKLTAAAGIIAVRGQGQEEKSCPGLTDDALCKICTDPSGCLSAGSIE